MMNSTEVSTASSTAYLRIALQARIAWERGEVVLPTPALTQYEPYRDGEHGEPPARSQDPLYWHIQEFDV